MNLKEIFNKKKEDNKFVLLCMDCKFEPTKINKWNLTKQDS